MGNYILKSKYGMKRYLKLLTGLQNFKSTLNFVIIMEPRTILLYEEFQIQSGYSPVLAMFSHDGWQTTAIPTLTLYSRTRQASRQGNRLSSHPQGLPFYSLELEPVQNETLCPGAKYTEKKTGYWVTRFRQV